ncbi:hypothetical protein [Bosea sp. ASV33]|uniref:hypothetical protein n=1 Tax=Bosea sp. ASV33 TaxID=2795106 RepID=UPI0032C0F3F1
MWTLSRAKRSEIMKAVRRENTAPEMVVRRLLHGLGFRYRLHAKELWPATQRGAVPRGSGLCRGACRARRVPGCAGHDLTPFWGGPGSSPARGVGLPAETAS